MEVIGCNLHNYGFAGTAWAKSPHSAFKLEISCSIKVGLNLLAQGRTLVGTEFYISLVDYVLYTWEKVNVFILFIKVKIFVKTMG